MKKKLVAAAAAAVMSFAMVLTGCGDGTVQLTLPTEEQPEEPSNGSSEVETIAPIDVPEEGFADGVYSSTTTGAADAGSGDLTATVTIEGGAITAVEIDAPKDIISLGEKAINSLPALIVEANGIDGVAATAGASQTSAAIFRAVADCLLQASGGAPEAGGKYVPGTYTGHGYGVTFTEEKGGDIFVTITVDETSIVSVDEIKGDNETPAIGGAPIEDGTFASQIMAAQGAQIEGVSGATMTSNGIREAVADALNQAKATGGDEPETEPAETEPAETEPAETEPVVEPGETEPSEGEKTMPETPGKYNDGIFSAVRVGSEEAGSGDVTVEVTIENGYITQILVIAPADKQNTGKDAAEAIPDAIIEAQGIDGVETVAEATQTSQAILDAVVECLEIAGLRPAESAGYKDGVYSATVTGAEKAGSGDLTATVTIEGGVITAVDIVAPRDNLSLGQIAIQVLPAQIVAANGVEGVDAYAGVSQTSDAIFAAVNQALEQAVVQTTSGYKDGVYSATVTGAEKAGSGDLTATVTIEGGVITAVDIVAPRDNLSLGQIAIQVLPAQIVAANGVEGVDAYAGVSQTSDAIFAAVKLCMEEASGGAGSAEPEPAETEASEAEGTETEPAETEPAESETEPAETEPAETESPEKVIPVDTETKEAEEGTGLYKDGVYTAEVTSKAPGNGQINVTVTIEGGQITAVEIDAPVDQASQGGPAIQRLPKKIIDKQGTEGVKTVTGCTLSSESMLEAVNLCLEQAKGSAAEEPETEEAEAETAEAAETEPAETESPEKVIPAEAETKEAEETEAAETESAETTPAESETEPAETETEPVEEEQKVLYKDGVYSATTVGAADAGYGDLTATVTVENGVITKVEIDAPRDKASVGYYAIMDVPNRIVAANGTEGVDENTNASHTSRAIFEAVNMALEDAIIKEQKYADGVYTATTTGAAMAGYGDLTATVTIENDTITSVVIDAPKDNASAGMMAIAELPGKIVAANGTEGVDVTAFASQTSAAIFTAVNMCLEEAEAKAKEGTEEEEGLKDGVYKATTVGALPAGSGDVNVTVTIEGGEIISVEIDAPYDAQSYGIAAIQRLPKKILDKQGTEGVKTVGGCTLTSQAILDAVNICLEEASK